MQVYRLAHLPEMLFVDTIVSCASLAATKCLAEVLIEARQLVLCDLSSFDIAL